MQKELRLTSCFNVQNQTHILYLFEKEDIYFKNLITYIKTGLTMGHELIIIENTVIRSKVQKHIEKLYTPNQIKKVHYVDNYSFYNFHNDFRVKIILDKFMDVLRPLINDNLTVRTWGHVVWKDVDNIIKKLEKYETLADRNIKEMGVISVCAYPALNISASLQNMLMRNHEYLMTDTEFVRSTLYGQDTKKK